MRRHKFAAFAIVLSTAWLLAPGGVSRAQDPEKATPNAVLKRRIEETWRVVPLQHGLLLVPRRASVRVKGIELGETGIAVDARPVTGSELVARLGADADAVMQLSYLASDERAALFAEPEARAAAGDATSATSDPDVRTGDSSRVPRRPRARLRPGHGS